MMKRFVTLIVSLVLMVGILAGSVSSKDNKYPNKNITIVVPVKAGGDTDSYARILAKYLKEALGVGVAINNVDGASGTIGLREVYNAKKDGYTALFFHDAAILSKISGATEIDLAKFKIVSIPIIDNTATLVVSKKRFTGMKDFLKAAKSGEKIIASVAAGSLAQLAPLMLEKQQHLTFKYVDSTSAADRIADLLAGRIDLFFTQYGLISQYIKSGDFASLGVMSDKRNPNFPDVPTFKEQGVKISMEKIFYLVLPPETPDKIVNTLAKAVKKACDSPAIQKELGVFFVKAVYKTPQASVKIIKEKKESYEKYEDYLK
jgi:tripartite-type tricarboxylate transporter receptor subunit TctC